MTRVKRGVVASARHKKLRQSTKGYRGTRNRLTKVAQEAQLHAVSYAFHGRKRKKRDFRRLWITRIGEAVKQHGISYNAFIHSLKVNKIGLDRKILSNLVVNDPKTFEAIVKKIKTA